MQKLIISSEAHDAHERYSCCIREILEHIASGKELYLSGSNKEENSINLNREELSYFSKLLDLYNKTDFLLVEPQKLKQLIKDEKDICDKIGWKERPQKINTILKRIFGYDEGFSKGKFIHLKEYNGTYIIQHSRRPPDGGTKWGAVEFIESLNVDYCVYCNEASLYHEDGNGKRSYSHSSLDHFYNKSTYPFLALTLTNLIPSCTQCNSSIKSTHKLPENALNPYEGSFHESVHFHLEDEGETKTDMLISLRKLLEKNFSINDLKISGTKNAKFADNAMAIANFFMILDRYKIINDLENDIKKIRTYSEIRDKGTLNALPIIKSEKGLFPELFYQESEINKYRFAKLFIDLCKEAGIRS